MKVLIKLICIKVFLICSGFIQANDTIIVGGDFNYPPYSFVDENGNEAGYDVDVIRAIMKEINLEVVFKFDHWDSTLNRLKNGQVDVIASIVYSESREQYFDFTFPLHTEYYAIFAQKKAQITDVYDLKSKRAAYLPGDISNEKFLQPMGLLSDSVQVSSLPEAFSKINNEMCDYVIAPYPLGKEIIDERGFKQIKVKGPPIIPSVYCLAVKEGDTKLLARLNLGIEQLSRSGELDNIYNKWIRYKRSDDRYQNRFKYALYILGGLAGVIIILFVFWNSLRIQVRKKTNQIRNAEEVYRKIFKSVDDVILVGTTEGIITDANAKAIEVYKDSFDKIIGRSVFDIVDDANKEFVENAFVKLKSGEETIFGEIRKLISGNMYYFKVVGERIHFENEDRFLVVFHDITEEKESINKLLEAKRIADEANNAKSSFLASVSHEVRTPLNAILGYSNLLTNNNLTKVQFDYNRKIALSAEILLGLINNVLDIAKIEAKKFTLNQEPFSLTALINKICEIQHFKATEKKLLFQANISNEIPEWVIGDELRLTQVLLNILNNAVKFTNKGLISLKVNYENITTDNTKRVLFSVKDTGVGISPDKINNVFMPFEQVENNTNRMYSGTGLGLPIAQHLVKLMNGEIIIDSNLHKGTLVNISIPLKLVEEKYSTANEVEQHVAVNDDLNGINVLLVEDNEFNAEILIEQLVDTKAIIKHAETGYKAIEILGREKFDVILMDIEMPGLDGYETARVIKGENLSLAPIIALSAHTLNADKEKSKKAGMVSHLSKPVKIEKVVDAIRNAVVNKQQALIEPEKAIQIFGGSKQMYNRALKRFSTKFNDIPDQLEFLFKNNKAHMPTVFHNLKSACKTIGAYQISEAAHKFEHAFRNENVSVELEQVIDFAVQLRELINFISSDE